MWLVLGCFVFKVILEERMSSEQTNSTGHSLLPTITLLKWGLSTQVSWSEAATLKGSAGSHWLQAGNALGKLSKQSTDGHLNKHPWSSLSPSLRQNWTDGHHPHLLLKTFCVEDAGHLCSNWCSAALSIKKPMSNLYYLPSANKITCFPDDFGEEHICHAFEDSHHPCLSRLEVQFLQPFPSHMPYNTCCSPLSSVIHGATFF